ncbi:MAG: hypothetical protein IKG80_06245 [Clostridia bacterium]|nr:hypothetical protein [Clostridia bacterium]
MFFKKRIIDPDAPKIGRIESFEFLKLHLSGMRLIMDIEITQNGDESSICSYRYVFGQDGRERELETSVSRPASEIIEVLNKCEVGKWSGFHGPHPPHVLDGTMFDLSGTVNGGVTLRADGSENFPPNYREFTDFLFEKLREAEKKEDNE